MNPHSLTQSPLRPIKPVLNRACQLIVSAAVVVLAAALGTKAPAQTLELNFPFSDAPGNTTADAITGALVHMTNYTLVAADLHGTNGSGPGKLGRSVDFTTDDGAASANTCSGSASTAIAADWNDSKISLGTISTFTMTFWFKNAAVFGSGDSPLLFELGAGADPNSDFALDGANTIGFAENTSGNPEFWAGANTCPNPVASGSLSAGVWYFYALTYDGSNYRVYVGNETNAVTLVNTISKASQTLAFGTSGTLIFGNRGSDHARNFPGWLAYFRLYNGNATLPFIDAVRQSDLPLTASPTTFTPPSPVTDGTVVTLSATVTNGVAPYLYTWQVSNNGGAAYTTLPSGNGNPTYSLNTSGQGGTANFYQLIVTDSESPAVTVTNISSALVVSTGQIPPIPTTNTTIVPPTIILGGSATMTGAFTGTLLSYQWEYSATNDGSGLIAILGATNSTFVLTNAQYSNTGYYELVAYNSAGTNNSGLASLTVQAPVTITIGPVAGANPAAGLYDIAQLSTTGDVNFPGANALNYFDNNSSKPGQTFTTGGNPGGYSMANLYYKCGGPVISNGSHPAGAIYTLRIYSMTNATVGSAVLISTYTNQNTAAAIPNNVWAQWNGMTNVFAPNSSYAYSISAGSGFMHMGNASNTPAFYNGGLGLIPTAGGAVTFATPADTSDATFLVNLVPAGYPFIGAVNISPASSSTNLLYAGTIVTLSGSAMASSVAGATPLYFQWQTDNGSGGANWTALLSGTNATSPLGATYSLNTSIMAAGTYQFRLVVTNSFGSVTSSIVQLYLLGASAPQVTQDTIVNPTGVFIGGSATMTAAFTGSPTISYQWMFNNGSGAVAIPGATNTTYVLSNAQLTNSGAYFLQASNGVSPYVADSTPVQLVVAPAGQANSTAVTISDAGPGQPGSSAPAVGSNDIAQLQYNFPTALSMNYYVNNSAPPGQTFTTSNNPPTSAGYPLTGVYVQDEYATESGGATNSPQTYTLDIYQIEGTNAVLLTSYTTVNTFVIPETGDWIQFSGMTNYLQPNSTYGFSIRNNGTGYWKLGNDQGFGAGDLYTNGQAALFPASGIGALTFDSDSTVDAAFIVHLSPEAAPILEEDTVIKPTLTVAGSNVTMSAFFSGAAPLNYQWEFVTNNVTNAIAGATNTTYNIAGATLAETGDYYLLAWNGLGTNSSTSTALGIVPMILTQDTAITSPVFQGQYATMNAAFEGFGITYQWMFNNGSGPVAISGATNSTYTFAVTGAGNAGSYYLVASNSPSGVPSVLSSTPVTLTVAAPPSGFVADFAYWDGHPGAASPGYSGLGAIGAGSTWNRINPVPVNSVFGSTTATLCTNTSGLGDDGASLNIGFSTWATVTNDYYFFSSVPPGEITLFDTYMDNSGANAIPFKFNNLPGGAYNVVLYAEDGHNANGQVTFDVNGVNQTVANTSQSVNQFIQGNNYAVYTNILVTNGTLSGTWVSPSGGTAYFNGAQIQMAYSLVNPQIFIFSEPGTNSVPVGQAAGVNVVAEGPGQLFYQWYYTNTVGEVNGTPVAGATNSSYSPDTSTAFTNSYYVVVANATGLTTNSTVGTISTFVPTTVSWRGTASSSWDFTSLNWSNVSQQIDGVAYANPDFVILDDSAASFDVSNAIVVAPSSVVADNNLNNYVIFGTGNMSGNMSLTMNGTASLTISNNNTFTGGTVVKAGTLALAKGGSAGSLVGTLAVNPAGTVNLQVTDALGYSAGTCVTNVNIFGGVLTDISGGNEGFNTTFNLTGGTMSSTAGAYNLNGAGAAINSFATNNVSTISAPITLRSSGLTITTAAGTVSSNIDLNISGAIGGGAYSLAKAGTGTLLLSGGNTYSGTTTVGAGTLLVNGVVPGVVTVASGATLGGSGTIDGVVTINSGATIGASPGIATLTLGSSPVLGGSVVAQINRNAGSPIADKIVVGNTVTFAGSLTVNNAGTALQAGDSFTLFTATGYSGNFVSTNLPALNAGLHYTFANGVLSVLPNVATNPTNITFSVSGNVLTLSWPSDHTGWQLQAQTNSVSTGLSGNWVNVAGTTATNELVIPAANSGCVFYRLIYTLP